MKELIGKEVNLLVSSKSGAGASAAAGVGAFENMTNGYISVNGTLKAIENDFLIIENVIIKITPMFLSIGKGLGSNPAALDCFSYSKTLINKDYVITISLV